MRTATALALLQIAIGNRGWVVNGRRISAGCKLGIASRRTSRFLSVFHPWPISVCLGWPGNSALCLAHLALQIAQRALAIGLDFLVGHKAEVVLQCGVEDDDLGDVFAPFLESRRHLPGRVALVGKVNDDRGHFQVIKDECGRPGAQAARRVFIGIDKGDRASLGFGRFLRLGQFLDGEGTRREPDFRPGGDCGEKKEAEEDFHGNGV